MMLVESFLFALTNANKDGRVMIQRQGKWIFDHMHMDTHRKLFLTHNSPFFSSMSFSEQSEVSLAERRSSLRTDHPGVQGRDHRWRNPCSPSAHTHTHTHTHARSHKHTHTRSHTHAHTHAHTHTHAQTHTRTHTHTHAHTNTHTNTNTHTHTHTQKRTRTHTHTCAHTKTHTHTHTLYKHCWTQWHSCLSYITLNRHIKDSQCVEEHSFCISLKARLILCSCFAGCWF